MEKETFIIIPNYFIWAYEEGEISLVKGLNSKMLNVISFIKDKSDIHGESCFSLEYLVTRCGYKPNKNKGKSNEQFKACLLQLVEVGLLEDINNTVKNCKANSLIICRLNLPKVESQFFKLNYSTVKEILSLNGDKATLLNIYSYILARIHRRKDSKRLSNGDNAMPFSGISGRAEVFYDSQENIAYDLGIDKKTLNKHIKILAEARLICYGNNGLIRNKAKETVKNSNNVYALNEEELEAGLKQQAYSYMQNKETTILGKRQSDSNFKANGIKAQIKLREQLGLDTTTLESKLEQLNTFETPNSIPLTKKEMQYIAKAREDFNGGSKDNNKSKKQSIQEQYIDDSNFGNVDDFDIPEEEYLKVIDDVDFNNEDDDLFKDWNF